MRLAGGVNSDLRSSRGQESVNLRPDYQEGMVPIQASHRTGVGCTGMEGMVSLVGLVGRC